MCTLLPNIITNIHNELQLGVVMDCIFIIVILVNYIGRQPVSTINDPIIYSMDRDQGNNIKWTAKGAHGSAILKQGQSEPTTDSSGHSDLLWSWVIIG